MVRIAVCDDMPGYGDALGNVIKDWANKKGINIELKMYASGEKLIADIENTGYFHIVFLDIALGQGADGVTVATRIKEQYRDVCLIFVTQYDNYYKKVFKLHPFQYLEKPILQGQLVECLEQALFNCRCLHEVFVFRYKNVTSSIRIREILYFESDKRTVKIYMEDGEEYLFYNRLDSVEDELRGYNYSFLRIHKSYLVNTAQILQFYPQYVVMRNKKQLPISKKYRECVMKCHADFLKHLC